MLLQKILNLLPFRRQLHLSLAAEQYAEGRDCDGCGQIMHVKEGVVVQWDNGSMTAKHLGCALPLHSGEPRREA